MTWRDLLSRLDKLRVQLRAEHGKELDAEIPEGDRLAQDIKDAMNLDSAVNIFKPLKELFPTETQEATQLDDLFACAPEPSATAVQEVVERGSGEGRMLVMKRETPLIVRPPVLEEVTEEELGK